MLFSYHSVGAARNVWRLKEAPLPPLYAFDRTGHAGWSEIATSRQLQQEARAFDLTQARDAIAHYRNRFLTENLSKYPQAVETSDLPERYVFLALQVQNDPVARFFHIDTISLIQRCARLARETDCHLVIKRHPHCNNQLIGRMLDELRLENPRVQISQASVHHLIANAQSVVTINSGVGLEALIHGKPVYAAGLSEWTPAAIEVKHIDALAPAFERDQPALPETTVSYVGYLLREYWVDSTDVAALQRRVDHCLQCYDATGDNAPSSQEDGRNLEYDLLQSNTKIGELTRRERALDYMFQLAQKDRLELSEAQEALRASNPTLCSLKENIARLIKENDDLKHAVLGLKTSTSWKVTAPMRRAKQLLTNVARRE